MAVPTTFLGTPYNVPEVDETGWGQTVTNLLVALAKVDNVATLVSSLLLLVLKPANSSLAGGATLTPTANWHRVSGSGGAVTLSASSAIADGSTAGQLLVLSGTDGTNTVTIQDSANTKLNGTWVGGLNDVLVLIWDATLGDWLEIARNN